MEDIISSIFIEKVSDEEIIRKIRMHPCGDGLVKHTDGDGNTILMHVLSTQNRRIELVKYLLRMGSDVNIVNAWAGTPLSRASCKKSTEYADLVLSYGADPNAYVSTWSRLFGCIYQNNQNVAMIILLHGGRLREGEYERLSSDGRRMLANFCHIVKLSSLAYTQLKKVQVDKINFKY